MKNIELKIYWLLILAILVYFFHLLSPILSPFLFAALLAYLGDPIADRLEKKMSRTLAVVVVFFTIFTLLTLVILIFIPLVSDQLSKLISKLPIAVDAMQNRLVPFLHEQFEYESNSSKDVIGQLVQSHLKDIPSLANRLLAWVTGSGEWIFAILANIFLVPVVTFYLLRDWDGLVEKFHALIPRKYEAKITQLAQESDTMLAAFLRGQFAVMNALGLIYAIGLSVVGLDSAIIIGFIAGWLSFVPYLGLVVGLAIATSMAYFQFDDVLHPMGIIITFVFAQILEGSVLTPKFVGERIGLHPVAVIFAILAGGQLGGFSGILLALPLAAILNVLISHAQLAYQSSKLYN